VKIISGRSHQRASRQKPGVALEAVADPRAGAAQAIGSFWGSAKHEGGFRKPCGVVRLLVGFLAIMGVLLGCSSSPPSVPGPAEPLIVWLDAAPPELEFLEREGRRWTEGGPGRPGVVWRLTRFRELKPTLLGLPASAVEPDLVLAANDWLGELAHLGKIASWPDLPDRFPAAVREALSWQGAVWGRPWTLETVGLITNPAILATPPATLAELASLAPALRARQIIPLMYDNKNWYVHAVWLHGFGGRLAVDDPGFGLAGPAALAAANLARSLEREMELVPAKCNEAAMVNFFVQGRVAAIITGPWSLPRLEGMRTPPRVSPVPRLETGQPAVGYVSVKTWVLPTWTKKPEMGRSLVEHLLGAPVQANLARELGLLAALDPGTAEPQVASPRQAFAELARTGVPLPNHPWMREVWLEGNGALERVFLEDLPVADIFGPAAARLEQIRTAGSHFPPLPVSDPGDDPARPASVANDSLPGAGSAGDRP
jgi:maltose/maltodextrin transport system substrate-binding protein